MSAAHVSWTYCACALFTLIAACAASGPQDVYPNKYDTLAKKIDLFGGVTVKIPRNEEANSTGKMLTFEIDTTKSVEGRGKQKKLLERILPMFIMPFLIQSTIVPFFLSMLKFMLFKSLMVGKLALGLILLNAFRNHNTSKGRHDVQVADVHYGYRGNGMEEIGSYFN